MSPSAVLPGAEPFSSSGGPDGVLVLHGFTGCPQSMRGLAEAFAAAGFTTELPLLPGHGTSIEDMIPTRWEDWYGAAEAAYHDLDSRCDRVAVAGLSMGGTLACRLAVDHADVAGLVLVNPAVQPPADSFVEMMQGTLDAGMQTISGVGNDIARPESTELAYDATPVAAVMSLFEATRQMEPHLGRISCPVLLITSRQDHVVPPESSDLLASSVSGPVDRLWLERSYHVATLDYEADEIERRAVEFARKLFG
ncbi:MAG TPA: alpha/beta fold hydrolase [Acidimicrobiales bacterium]|nr:alpha/beta fold hydrolase [Acidimicrobiales bacterium]